MAAPIWRLICPAILITLGSAGCATFLTHLGSGPKAAGTAPQTGGAGKGSSSTALNSLVGESQSPGVHQSDEVASLRTAEHQHTPSSVLSVRQQDHREPSPVSISLLVEELETEGLLTPETKTQLVDDLCRTPPNLWPAIVETFRATMELRKKRAASDGGGPVSERSTFASTGETHGSGEPSFATAHFPAGENSSVETPPSLGVLNRLGDTLTLPGGTVASGGTVAQPPDQPQGGLAASGLQRIEAPSQADVKPASFRPNDSQNPAIGEALVTDTRELLAPGSSARKLSMGWTDYVKQAIEGIESEAQRTQPQEIRLRLLQLALSNRDAAVQPISGLSPALQEFWSETLFSLALLSDNELNSDPQLRLTEARRHLQTGLRRLSEECPLEVTGLAFVTAVQSWGVYDAFEKYEFTPGQKVLLYAEVENLSAESTPKGYRTAWRSSYQILDSTGKEVARYEYAPNEEYCRRPRRDFFIGCELSLPAEAAAGRYTLRLTVVDLIRNRVGQGTIEFSLRSKSGK